MDSDNINMIFEEQSGTEQSGGQEYTSFFDFLQNKYFLTAILLAIAGGVYGITNTIDSLEINFTLYCCSVWFVALACIFLANYTRSSSPSK